MCEKNVQADETPLGQKALEREQRVLGAERWLLSAEGNLSFITFAELDELQSLHLQRDEDCNSGAFAHPYCNSSTGWGQERTLGPSKMGSTVQNLYKAETPHPTKKNTTPSVKKGEPAKTTSQREKAARIFILMASAMGEGEIHRPPLYVITFC